MKKFTKIMLIIAGSLAALGIVFSGIAAVMGAGWSTIHRKALAGELDFGNWHIGNGVYYAYDQGHGILDHFWDDDYDDWDDDYDDDDDWDDDDWDNDDWDDEDDELMDDNRAVESFGSWILNLTDLKSEPAGTESCIIPYPASEAASLKLELDVVNELIFEVSDSADEISIKMENGYQDYLSTKQKDSALKVSYHSGHHHFEKGPIDTVLYNFTAIQSMKDVKKKVLAYTQDTHVTVLPRKKKLNSDIIFENVTFKRKSFALENINLTIKKGMKYAVIGHSGAGKSTLFKLIMGYEKNSSGVIRLDGEDIRNYDISELISYTDQNEHIYRAGIVDNITVFHSYPMDGIDSVGKNIWPEFFEGIFNRKEKECQRFSGGEKQAVAFLRMAAKNAEVILLDEPFSAMDAKMKSAVEHYLFTGKEFEGKTVLVITHDTREESLSQYDGIIHVGENGIYVE